MAIGNCPDCGGEVPTARHAEVGDLVFCPECDLALQVIGMHPLRLSCAPEDEGYLDAMYYVKLGESYLEEYYAERAGQRLWKKRASGYDDS